MTSEASKQRDSGVEPMQPDASNVVDAAPYTVDAPSPAIDWAEIKLQRCWADASVESACTTWHLFRSGTVKAVRGPVQLTPDELSTVERAVEDAAFVDGMKHGFPGGPVADAGATLTVSTTKGQELSQDVSFAAFFDGKPASALTMVVDVVDNALLRSAPGCPAAPTICCCASGDAVAAVCSHGTWTCSQDSFPGACCGGP